MWQCLFVVGSRKDNDWCITDGSGENKVSIFVDSEIGEKKMSPGNMVLCRIKETLTCDNDISTLNLDYRSRCGQDGILEVSTCIVEFWLFRFLKCWFP
jgi:hypothetical protein